MKLPSGDQTGSNDIDSTRRTGGRPSAGILKTCVASPSRAAMAIHAPSGDHDGAPRTSSDSASVRSRLPSTSLHRSVDRARQRTAAQIVLPLGDTPTAPDRVPSLGRQSSAAAPREKRHSASAPPREARYSTDESGAYRGPTDREVGSDSLVALVSPDVVSPIGTLHNSALGLETVATSRLGFPDTSALAAMERTCSTPELSRIGVRSRRSIRYSHGPVPSSSVAV